MRILTVLIGQNIATNATISPTSSSSSSLANNVMIKTANSHIWKSPIPYLFGSLALMLLLITVALILLVFSYRKRSSPGDSRSADDQPPKVIKAAADLEPKVLVIMAGDDKPTYLATPSITIAMPSTNVCSCDQIKSSDQD